MRDQPICVSLNFFDLSDEVDEIEVYGSEAQSGTQLATYSFEVRKKNLNCLLCKCRSEWKVTDGVLNCVSYRCVIAYSTSDLVQTPPWVNLPSCPKRYTLTLSSVSADCLLLMLPTVSGTESSHLDFILPTVPEQP